jgi:hypothetical protein
MVDLKFYFFLEQINLLGYQEQKEEFQIHVNLIHSYVHTCEYIYIYKARS